MYQGQNDLKLYFGYFYLHYYLNWWFEFSKCLLKTSQLIELF